MLSYEWKDGSGILCPTFNVSRIDKNTFGCVANFSLTPEICNNTAHLTLEAWLQKTTLIKAYGKAYVNCSKNFKQPVRHPSLVYNMEADMTSQSNKGLILASALLQAVEESFVPLLFGPTPPSTTAPTLTSTTRPSTAEGERPDGDKSHDSGAVPFL